MEEISLRELFGILYKRRFVVIGITVASVLLSLVYSFFIAVPIYHAQAEIKVNDMDTGAVAFDKANSAGDTVDALLEKMKDLQFMEQVSKSLEMKDIEISRATLKLAIYSSKGKDGRSIVISVKYKGKKEAAPIANSAVDVLGEYLSQYLDERMQKQLDIAEEQIRLGKATAEEALFKYKEYVSGTESLIKLQSEIDINKSVLIQLKSNLMSGNTGLGKSKRQIEQDITTLEEEIQLLHERLAEESLRDRLYNKDLNSSLAIYSLLRNEYEKLKIGEMYLSGNSNMEIISHAVEPEAVYSPNRKLIIISSLVLGICIGILVAITIEYFKGKSV